MAISLNRKAKTINSICNSKRIYSLPLPAGYNSQFETHFIKYHIGNCMLAIFILFNNMKTKKRIEEHVSSLPDILNV